MSTTARVARSGLNDVLKVGTINGLYRTLDCDWVLAPDADEFVFPLPLGTDVRRALDEEHAFDVVYAQMWPVYRHRTDGDLDPTRPAITEAKIRRDCDEHLDDPLLF